MVYFVVCTVYWIFVMVFHLRGWVFGDWDEVIGILDGDYVIWDNY